MGSLVEKSCILFDVEETDKLKIIKKMVKALKVENKISEEETFLKDVLEREEISQTSMGYDLGLPHGKSEVTLEPAICFVRLKNEVVWNTENGEKAKIVLLIAAKKVDETNIHVQILSKLARKLVHEEFRQQLLTLNQDEIFNLLTETLEV